jgi:hypothetical protein
MSDRPESVRAWEEFCEQLKAAGAVLARPSTPADELSQAEGLRKLARMVRVGLEATLEYADTRHPEVYPLVTPTTLGEGETSDARYHQALIDGRRTYRIEGARGDAPFVEFTAYAGKIGLDAHSAQVGALTERELAVDADGRYELVLSRDPHPGNWIRTTPETSLVFIREYAHDWSRTRGATFAIRCADSDPVRPPLSLAEVTRALPRTAAYVARATATWAAIADRAREAPPNRLVPFVDEGGASPEMPTGHRFASGHFRLARDEALLVEFRPADVPYWGLDITNYWFEPISFPSHRSHVNDRTAKRGDDGSVIVAIAPRDAGAPNWIDTRGHGEGMMMFRWSRTALALPEIRTRLVALRP